MLSIAGVDAVKANVGTYNIDLGKEPQEQRLELLFCLRKSASDDPSTVLLDRLNAIHANAVEGSGREEIVHTLADQLLVCCGVHPKNDFYVT